MEIGGAVLGGDQVGMFLGQDGVFFWSDQPLGAEQGIGFRWKKSSPIANGNELQRRSQAASSAFVTSF